MKMSNNDSLSLQHHCLAFIWKCNKVYEEKSPPLKIQQTQFHLEFYTGWRDNSDYRLRLVSDECFSEPFDLSVYLMIGGDSVSHCRTSVQSGNTIIWKSTKSDILKIVSDFEKRSVHFKIVYHNSAAFVQENKTEDKSVQTPEYVDANFEMQSLSRDLSKLLDEDTKNMDVELECGGLTFKAHRSLLSARSEVFRAMLGSDMKEGNTGQVLITDVEADLFRQFLRYLYTGKLEELNLDTAMRLHEVADKYHVDSLKRQCASFLADRLSEDNVCSILSLAERHSDAQLKEDATAYILDRNIPLRDDEPSHDWSQFAVSHPTVAVEVLTRLC